MKLARILVLAAALPGTTVALAEPSLCTRDEVTEWSCSVKEAVHSLCASRDLGPRSGYLQYRARTREGMASVFPDPPRHPAGLFRLRLAPRGASLRFTIGGREHWIHEPLAGSTSIEVLEAGRSSGVLDCDWSTDTLTLTATQNRFRRIGIFP